MDNGSDHHFGLAVNVAIEALKSLIFLNGGAGAALIALTGKDSGAPNYATAILAFGIGVWLAVLAFTFGYFSQLSYANHRNSHESANHDQSTKDWRRHDLCQKVALALVFGSLISGSIGMFEAWRSANVTNSIAPCNCVKPSIQPTQGR